MPVTTRAQSRRLQAAGLLPASKRSTTKKQSPTNTRSATIKQSTFLEESQPFTQNPPQPISDRNPSQASDKQKSHRILTEIPSEGLSGDQYFWPCAICSCEEAVFEGLVDSCVTCSHTMDSHGSPKHSIWKANCDYLCKRSDLVKSLLHRTRENGVMVIRATPMVGKTTLLHLLGLHMVENEPDLEPILISWLTRKKRDNMPYQEYLKDAETRYRRLNAEHRPRNPSARSVYLIDEAQGSYEEEDLWERLKNYHTTRSSDLFILICLYGAAGLSHTRDPNTESQALRMHTLHRIELRPTKSSNLCMLFSKEELGEIVYKFTTYHGCQIGPGVVDYLYTATDGHPGMIGMLFAHPEYLTRIASNPLPKTLTVQYLHKMIVKPENSFVDALSKYGRGLWTPEAESHVQRNLPLEPAYKHLKLLDVKKVLFEAARYPDGLNRVPQDGDAFAFCHKNGYLNTEQSIFGRDELNFIFPSPLHRRLAFRRLIEGREPDTFDKNLSLQKSCIDAIARFSPEALQNRRYSQSGGSWEISEAAFQDELYCCLSRELHSLPILSEYSHRKNGRIDFSVSTKKWGIEVLQCGSSSELAEHISRFESGGNYEGWKCFDDYIILNFCSRSKLRGISIQDENIKSHLLHIVIEPGEMSAEIHTPDKVCIKTWSLGEGRHRQNSVEIDFDSDSMVDPDEQKEKERMLLIQDVMRQRNEMEKRHCDEVEKLMEQIRELKRGMEEMRPQMEQEREASRLQMISDQDQEAESQVQDTSAVETGKKRKR